MGTILSSGADILAADRPAADVYYTIRVNDNGATAQVGLLKIANTGIVTVGSTIANAVFTNAAAADVLRVCVSWTVA